MKIFYQLQGDPVERGMNNNIPATVIKLLIIIDF